MSQEIEEYLDDEIGQSSAELEKYSDDVEPDAIDEPKQSRFSMNVFEVMLLISLLSITAASLMMLFELRTFGDFPGSFPWRVDEAIIK